MNIFPLGRSTIIFWGKIFKVDFLDPLFLEHAKALEKSTTKYSIKRVVCKAFAIPQNYRDVNHEKLFSGQLPTRIVIEWVDNRAFNSTCKLTTRSLPEPVN